MKVSILMNDRASSDDFLAEQGLSLYIEMRKHRILFDAGKSAAFAENAQRLGIDLSKVDIAILSQGYYNHGGGFNVFSEVISFNCISRYFTKRQFCEITKHKYASLFHLVV